MDGSSKLEDPDAGMFPPSTRVKLAVRERDNGLWLIWKCPRCAIVTHFNAVVSQGNIQLIGLPLSDPLTMIDLRCTRCGYDLRIDPGERTALEPLRDMTRSRLEGQWTQEQYEAAVLQMPTRFVQDLSALTRHWKCAACGEENPANFDACWNCASGVNSASDVPDDAKPFPTSPKGGNSWEQ